MVKETSAGWIRLALALLLPRDRSAFAHHDRKKAVIVETETLPKQAPNKPIAGERNSRAIGNEFVPAVPYNYLNR